MDDKRQRETECGRFQVCTTILSQMARVSLCWGLHIMMFGNYEPPWRCVLESAKPKHYLNLTHHDTVYRTSSDSPINDIGGFNFDNNYITSPTIGLKNHDNYYYSNSIDARDHLRDDLKLIDSKEVIYNGTCKAFQLCQKIEFQPGTSTIITEFYLICDKSWIASLIISIQMMTVIPGAYFSGQIGERFGRKVSVYGSTVLLGIASTLAIFSTTWEVYAFFMAVLGFAMGGILVTCNIYTFEFLNSWWRATLTSIPVFNIAQICFCATIAWLRDWRLIHIASGAVAGISCLGVFWIPESVRWLDANGKTAKANKVRKTIYRMNKIKVDDADVEISPSTSIKIAAKGTNPQSSSSLNSVKLATINHARPKGQNANTSETQNVESINADTKYVTAAEIKPCFISITVDDKLTSITEGSIHCPSSSINECSKNVSTILQEENQDESKTELKTSHTHATYLDLFRDPYIRNITIKSCFSWMFILITIIALRYGVKSLSGDFYVNAMIASMSDIPTVLCIAPISNYLGRRKAILIFASSAAASCLAIAVMSFAMDEESRAFSVRVLALVAKAFCQASWLTHSTMSAELYPTVLRSLGIGFLTLVSRCSGVVAPYLIPQDQSKFGVCFSIMAAALVASVFIAMSLPETKGKVLSDTLEEQYSELRQSDDNHVQA